MNSSGPFATLEEPVVPASSASLEAQRARYSLERAEPQVRPVYFGGEQVGERRYFDERLTTFILRTRDPVRFGAWRDRYDARQHPDGPGRLLGIALDELGGSRAGDTTACAIAMAADNDPSIPPPLLGDAADASCRDRDPADDWLSTERVLRPRPRPPSRHDVA